jgi:hypothetical protein
VTTATAYLEQLIAQRSLSSTAYEAHASGAAQGAAAEFARLTSQLVGYGMANATAERAGVQLSASSVAEYQIACATRAAAMAASPFASACDARESAVTRAVREAVQSSTDAILGCASMNSARAIASSVSRAAVGASRSSLTLAWNAPLGADALSALKILATVRRHLYVDGSFVATDATEPRNDLDWQQTTRRFAGEASRDWSVFHSVVGHEIRQAVASSYSSYVGERGHATDVYRDGVGQAYVSAKDRYRVITELLEQLDPELLVTDAWTAVDAKALLSVVR